MFEKKLSSKAVVRRVRSEDTPIKIKKVSKTTKTKSGSKDSRSNKQSANKLLIEMTYQRGYKLGQAEGEAKAKKDIDTALQAIHSAIMQHKQQEYEFFENIEITVLKLGTAIAEKVIKHEVQTNPKIIRNVVTRSLEMIKGNDRIVVQIHPEDLTILKEHWDHFKNELTNIGEWDMKANSTIERGGCLVETPNETIDARVDRQLELIGSYLEEGINDASNA